MSSLRLVALAVLLLRTLSVSSMAAPQATRATSPPENVKILTDLDGQALQAEMQRMATALGVDCNYCHVQGNFPSDERRPKRLARWMLELTRALNSQHFPKYQVKEGESVLGRVTCFTCHQGAELPATAPGQH